MEILVTMPPEKVKYENKKGENEKKKRSQ